MEMDGLIWNANDRTLRRMRPTGGIAVRPDPPPPCPGCGRQLELHEPRSMPDHAVGVCDRCRELVILARAASRAWTVAERFARGPAG
jgi:hypothetical protein